MGRAARHIEGRAILYADRITDSMRRAIGETDRRRSVQRAYNEENGITPQSIVNTMDMGLAQILKAEYGDVAEEEMAGLPEFASQAELDAFIVTLESQMRDAARKFEFEKAARLRDSIKELREKEFLFG
jgi:excinuclease ABC subunit B